MLLNFSARAGILVRPVYVIRQLGLGIIPANGLVLTLALDCLISATVVGSFPA